MYYFELIKRNYFFSANRAFISSVEIASIVTDSRSATFVFSVEMSLVFVFTAPSASSFTFVSATPAASKAVVSTYAADFKPATKTSVPSTATVPSVLPVATD